MLTLICGSDSGSGSGTSACMAKGFIINSCQKGDSYKKSAVFGWQK